MITRKETLLRAADLIERENSYEFLKTTIPHTCEDEGCILGWIGFLADFANTGPNSLLPVVQWLGYTSEQEFYDRFHAWRSLWTIDPEVAAQGVRKMAEEYDD